MQTMTFKDAKKKYDRKWIVYKTNDRPLNDESVIEVLESFDKRWEAEQLRNNTPGDDERPVGMVYIGFEPIYVGGLKIRCL